MGLFSKTPKSNPKIIVEGIEVTFHSEYEWWGFTYRGTEFRAFKPVLTLPMKAELDAILDTLESLKVEMRSRLQKGFSEWGNGVVKLDDGESYMVNLEDFAIEKSYSVSWSDGALWGDMGVDFRIKGREIIDESWGD